MQLLLYLALSQFREVQAAATRAIANLTQNIDNEPAIRAARADDILFRLYTTAAPDIKWQAKRALSNLEALLRTDSWLIHTADEWLVNRRWVAGY